MFSGANNITEIDLTKIDMNKVTDLKETFAYCHKLKTIYVHNDYAGTSNDSDTFIDCTSLIGGAGTKYDPTFIDSTAARIDGGVNNPGYFTAISDKPLETPQTNSETTGNEVRNVEAPAKEPDELETDSKQNESESQQ